jgi:hypothetical protein
MLNLELDAICISFLKIMTLHVIPKEVNFVYERWGYKTLLQKGMICAGIRNTTDTVTKLGMKNKILCSMTIPR